MKVGYAQNTITPSLDKPVWLAGFGNNRRAKTIHDDLYVRALAIQDDKSTLVLVALDLIGFLRRDVLDVMETLKVSETFRVLDPKVVIASVHPHHGPDTIGLWGPDDKTSGVDAEYLSALKNKIADVILASLSTLKPASISTTSVHVPGLAKNARNPEIVDDELTLAQFLTTEHCPLVTVFNFPCHPEVLWEHNPHITADYVGYLRDEVEKQTGAPCIFFAGGLGGMMTPDVKDHCFEEAEFMGKKLAEEGVKALQTIDRGRQTTVNGPSSTVDLQKKEIAVKLTNPLYKIAFLRKLIPDARNKKGLVETEVNLIKIGDLWLAAVPGELLPKLGLRVKAQLLDASRGAGVAGIVGLANDELGYIIPIEDFKYPWNPFKPGKHYEETNSIGKEIAPKVMSALDELLRGE